MEHGVTAPEAKEQRYYVALGRACDGIVRCKDCDRLVTGAVYTRQKGACPCGNKRFAEVTTLSPWEWFRIRVGLIRFPYRREFLSEFPWREVMLWQSR